MEMTWGHDQPIYSLVLAEVSILREAAVEAEASATKIMMGIDDIRAVAWESVEV
jgi:hypothetical protein